MNEDAVRTLLRESEIPATRLDVGRLMADSRRSRRRRRVATVTAVVLAAAAVAVPVAVVANRADRQTLPTGDFVTTTRTVHRTTKVGPAGQCRETPFPRRSVEFEIVLATDETGERVVGAAEGAAPPALFTRGEPTPFVVPNLRANQANITAVNTAGTVVGFDPADPAASFIYRDGVVRTLAMPAGYRHARAYGVNGHGDAVGLLGPPQSYSDLAGLVIWPAGSPDRPRVIPEPDLRPVAIRNDGTVIALRLVDGMVPHQYGDSVVVYRPDGTRLRIDAPARLSDFAVVRGDFLFSTVTPGGRPVRWNLRTGLVEIFDDLLGDPTASSGANAAGWFVATTRTQTAVVAPNGSASGVPRDRSVSWISADGSTRIGNRSDGSIVTSRC